MQRLQLPTPASDPQHPKQSRIYQLKQSLETLNQLVIHPITIEIGPHTKPLLRSNQLLHQHWHLKQLQLNPNRIPTPPCVVTVSPMIPPVLPHH